ncbi:hypothetical protein SERLA73DRAFT_188740 [Serpula lacrymans var. lacrymans S7.3]|uniref:Uncharacterized protein n=2 Tax=Serpula lacrymans var. lacrymans TaxID=341189 RepID=F8QC31_SERL3|nr:uncharacterized protein SERLADRAFT_479149 [Serpula lacrymans var. lacrymans S7.9]EGN94150.1 hypothetical protein SERLA73DRAFT_188740 [Serpula lacrymans var. lacrymans S7.3]EGO19578.1 hypothetical protein SERLADRAFT_479149 [Serpula lacrymans var. lacrymans S7.9]
MESSTFNASLIQPSLRPFPGSTPRSTECDPRLPGITGSVTSNHPPMRTRPLSSSALQLSRTGNRVWHGSTTEPCPPNYSSSQPSFRPSSVVPSFRTAESDMPAGTTESDLPAYSSVAARSRRSSAAPSYSTRPNTIVEPNLVLDPVPALPRMPSITLPYGDGRQIGWSSETI